MAERTKGTRKPPAELVVREPRRVSVTLSALDYEALERRSRLEGRSLSNLAAHLISLGLGGDAAA
jgi:hypothetical protein